MIIDIRGTHGSGKSFCVHHFKDTYNGIAIQDNGKIIGYRCLLPGNRTLGIVGAYERVCGGCDGIKTADEICRRVRWFESQDYDFVMLEGILVSHTFKRYNELADELEDYNFFFLNTPLKTCIARVTARRLAKGNHKPLSPTNITKDWNQIWVRTKAKLEASDQKVHTLHYKDPLSTLYKEMDLEC